jgi:hypothetical protein
MLGRDGEQKLLFGAGRKKITVGDKGVQIPSDLDLQRLLSKSWNLRARSRNLRGLVTSAG